MSQKDAVVTTKRVITRTTGSRRHLEKTHGTHNGRVDTFPHLSDVRDRPRKLPDLSPSVLTDRKRGRRHSRAWKPKNGINPFLYQDPAKGIPQRIPMWIVSGERAGDRAIVTCKVGAPTPDNACDIALELLRREHRLYIFNLRAEQVV
jgi:hypothetical protein